MNGPRAVALACALMMLPVSSGAQLADRNGVSLGLVRTQAERAVVRLAVSLLKDVELADQQFNRPNWLLFFTPEVDLKTGADDAFSSITAKLAATYVRFDTVVVEGVVMPNPNFYQMVPLAAGLEANRDFTTVSGILELGYVPWFQGAAPALFKTLKVGVFLQAGYKFERDTTRVARSEEALPDVSDEAAQQALGRIRGSLRWSPTIRLPESKYTLLTAADAWADVVNGAFYYRLEGTIRVKLLTDQFLDLTWERGAGAPNFNQGSQFSANLRVMY